LKVSEAIINERRQKIWTLLTRGMKRYEIAKELDIAHSTVSRDIKYLAGQSQKYLNALAKETLPFMYQTSIEGIRDVIKEAWSIYESQDKSINMYQKLGALKLIKECHESVFHLLDEWPSIMYVKQLQEKIIQIESRSLR
jgi:IS30 family transposase